MKFIIFHLLSSCIATSILVLNSAIVYVPLAKVVLMGVVLLLEGRPVLYKIISLSDRMIELLILSNTNQYLLEPCNLVYTLVYKKCKCLEFYVYLTKEKWSKVFKDGD